MDASADFESRPLVKLIKFETNFQEVLHSIKNVPDVEIRKKCPHSGASLLFAAAQRKNDPESLVIMTHLIEERGLDPTITDRDRQNPLFYAARDGNAETARYLIQKGCDVNHVDTALQTALFYGCREGRTEVARVLLENGCDVNCVDHLGQTALFYACRDGRISTVEFLLSRGASSSLLDLQKKSASHYASRGGHKEIVNLLKNFSATSAIKPIPNAQASQTRKRYRLQCRAPIESENEMWIFAPAGKIAEFESQFADFAVWDKNALTGFVHPALDVFRNSWQAIALEIISDLVTHEGGKIFAKPVDPKAWGCMDYYEIVKTPMDFSTIKKKLKSYKYQKIDEFVADVELVFKNCAMYNKPETPVGQVGRNVSSYFQNLKLRKGIDVWLTNQRKMDEFYAQYEDPRQEETGSRDEENLSSVQIKEEEKDDSEKTKEWEESAAKRSRRNQSDENAEDESIEKGDDEDLFSASSEED
eukprot:GHVP01065581.1.p2 GENE.GHVP01065581.1~~GHVP01065581.1.p2  ORF type:complete len:475 (+),score=91.96 GHVP01065581.1:2983-4407(+)